MEVEFVPIDKEQPELPYTLIEMSALPFPGEEVVLDPQFEVRVIKRQFFADSNRVRLFVRALPPEGTA